MARLWRDVDSEHGQIGVVLRRKGGEVRCGKRLYRWLWRH